jgi:2-polyprenyl-3-methyl-5-hydroxy-6-metoxy-1,4-benzoquinol methylase
MKEELLMNNNEITLDDIIHRIKGSLKQESLNKKEITPREGDFNIQHSVKSEISLNLAKLNIENEQNNKNWSVTPDKRITSHRKTIGPILVFFKKSIRKLLRWYINPAFDAQRNFNGSVTRSLNQITQLIPRLLEDSEKMSELYLLEKTKNEEMQNKLLVIETELGIHLDRKDSSSYELDYVLFEEKFRGTREAIITRQHYYLPYYIERANVLDIGCGRGEFIELLQANNVNVSGVDLNEDMVKYCQERGFKVTKENAIEFLKDIPDNTYDGIFMAQVIEHVTLEESIQLLESILRVLTPGGIVSIETINVQSVFAMSNWFYIDPTHVKPVHPATLDFLLQGIGYSRTEIKYLSPVPDVEAPSLEIDGKDLSEFNSSMRNLSNLIYGNQDYAIIAYK